MMLEDNIKGSFGMGGITKYMVEMLNEGCFKALIDVQCFDLDAVESIRNNPNHMEVSAAQYAGVNGSAVNSLDVEDRIITGKIAIEWRGDYGERNF